MGDDERDLIRAYQGAVQTVVAALRNTYRRHDLLAARHSREIPQRAAIGGVEFSFHGVGCRGTVGGIEVDFDFGPDGRTDGFYAWRLAGLCQAKSREVPEVPAARRSGGRAPGAREGGGDRMPAQRA